MNIDQPVALNDAIDPATLAAYLKAHIPGLEGDVQVMQFTAGHSNLTYLVKAGSRELVVKRSPPGPKAKSAHDMGREYAILSKLHGYYPYAPRAYAYCDDETVIGSAFCVMERLTGVIVRRQYEHSTPSDIISAQFTGLLDALADLHGIDVKAVGLGDFGRPQGYTQRQVMGWMKRMEDAKTDDMADVSAITAWMTAHIPPQSDKISVIHNDFKLDNLVWNNADPRRLSGVLDWEMSTVGDPLMDLACSLSFWVEPTDPPAFLALRSMPTLHPGVLSRREAAGHYAKRTGLAMTDFDFYRCFGFFRRAVIEQQKYVRYVRGATTDPRFANLNEAVSVLRDMCLTVINGAGA